MRDAPKIDHEAAKRREVDDLRNPMPPAEGLRRLDAPGIGHRDRLVVRTHAVLGKVKLLHLRLQPQTASQPDEKKPQQQPESEAMKRAAEINPFREEMSQRKRRANILKLEKSG